MSSQERLEYIQERSEIIRNMLKLAENKMLPDPLTDQHREIIRNALHSKLMSYNQESMTLALKINRLKIKWLKKHGE